MISPSNSEWDSVESSDIVLFMAFRFVSNVLGLSESDSGESPYTKILSISQTNRGEPTVRVSVRNFLNKLHRPTIPANSDSTLSISRGSTRASSGFNEDGGRRLICENIGIGGLLEISVSL